jgi:hypothetical protein
MPFLLLVNSCSLLFKQLPTPSRVVGYSRRVFADYYAPLVLRQGRDREQFASVSLQHQVWPENGYMGHNIPFGHAHHGYRYVLSFLSLEYSDCLSLAVAYSIISPIINGLACATFFLLYLLYKYLFLWCMQQPPSQDTGGLFFPKAIQHVVSARRSTSGRHNTQPTFAGSSSGSTWNLSACVRCSSSPATKRGTLVLYLRPFLS